MLQQILYFLCIVLWYFFHFLFYNASKMLFWILHKKEELFLDFINFFLLQSQSMYSFQRFARIVIYKFHIIIYIIITDIHIIQAENISFLETSYTCTIKHLIMIESH